MSKTDSQILWGFWIFTLVVGVYEPIEIYYKPKKYMQPHQAAHNIQPADFLFCPMTA